VPINQHQQQKQQNQQLRMSENEAAVAAAAAAVNDEFSGEDEDQELLKMMENAADDDDAELKELIERKRLLKAKRDEQVKRDQTVKSMVIDSSIKQQRRIEIEIRPKFLVPDTNCFIDHLSQIDKLLATGQFIIVVPLIVINELDKLAKSAHYMNYDSAEHADYVHKSAKQAVKFLNQRFEKGNEKNLKAMTSKGSVLETIQFRSEEIKKGKGTNDELILGCCLHYCRDNARDFMPSDISNALLIQ
jgi:protein SMG6